LSRASLAGAVVRGATRLPAPAKGLLAGERRRVDGVALNLDDQLRLRLGPLLGGAPIERLPLPQARAQIRAAALALRGPRPAMAAVEELGDLQGAPCRMRLYTPRTAGATSPGLVYFHGGGFVAGDLDTHDCACRVLAERSGVRVLSVAYRLAPECPFPAAVEDALAAYSFAHSAAVEIGIDGGRIAVGGDSAGGNLAAVVAAETASARVRPALQLLLYPWLDLAPVELPSRALFATGFGLETAELERYRDAYLRVAADAVDPRCSPLRRVRLERLPPAYVVSAGFDPLRDEAELYAARLRDAGVEVHLDRHAGLTHGFVEALGAGGAGLAALERAAAALRAL
jgi:acetyl esterase